MDVNETISAHHQIAFYCETVKIMEQSKPIFCAKRKTGRHILVLNKSLWKIFWHKKYPAEAEYF